MIVLTKLNGSQFVLNSQLIRTVEQTPDTTIRLTTGDSIIVRESMAEVIDRATEYEQLLRGLFPAT